MDDESLGGVLDIIDTEEGALHQKTAPVKEETKSETKESKSPEVKTETKTETKKETTPAEDDEEIEDTQDFNRNVDDESEAEVEDSSESKEPLQNESTDDKSETSTEDEDKLAPRIDPEPKFQGKVPEWDAEGYITNMTPQEYSQYQINAAAHQIRMEGWAASNETKALDAAEKILPEMKSSQAVRSLVENTRLASILSGSQINSYEAAKIVKESLGLSTKQVSDKVAAAKAEGAQSAKTSIQIQKNAAVETGSTKKKSDSTKDAHLTKRLKAGDDEAFAELLTKWDKEGKFQ